MMVCSIKRKCVFIIGFVGGFTFALLLLTADEEQHGRAICKRRYAWMCQEGEPSAQRKNRRTKPAFENADFSSWLRENGLNVRENVSYEAWLEAQGVNRSPVDLDYKQYGAAIEGKAAKLIRLESEWLKSKVNVICIVFVEKLKRAKAIRDSWGTSCNRLYFFSQNSNDTSLSVLNFSMKLTSSWQVLCEAMNYVWKNVDEDNDPRTEGKGLEWVIFVKDDTMVIPENLRYLVAPLDFNDGHYLGHPVVLWGQAYNVAQAGFVLSRGAFQKIIKNFDTHQKCASGGRYWKKEDYYLGKHLALLGIHPADTRDRHLRGIFHGYSLTTLLWGIARPGSYFTRALYPPGHDCCSPKSITFSTTEPGKMYTVNYMLYHLNVYSGGGYYGNQPAPTPMPEEEVWKSALREEFNITDVNNVDSQRYYNIWRSRYSDPEQLIRKNTWNLAHARKFLPSDYKSMSTMFN